MPHGNKKSRSGTSKKKNKGGRPANNVGANSSAKPKINDNYNKENEFERNKNKNDIELNQNDFPQWDNDDRHDNGSDNETKRPAKEFKTVYARYKEATERFKEALKGKVPATIFAHNTVEDLLDAVDYLVTTQTDIVIETEMIKDLKVAIATRKRAALHYSSQSQDDLGHEYFLQVLGYCLGRLRSLTKTTTTKRNRKKAEKTTDPTANRFDGLSLHEDDEEEDDDLDDMVELVTIPTTRPKVPERLSLEELILGTDRMAANLFLMSLSEIMGHNAEQFSNLKTSYRDVKQQGYPSSIIENLMETTVASNFAIQTVAAMEQQLMVDHPHMNTVYRLLAVQVLPQFAQDLTATVTKESPKAVEFQECHAYMFLGDALECAFRNPSDPCNRTATLASEFAAVWEIPNSKAEEMVKMVNMMVGIESPLQQERGRSKQFFEMVDGMQSSQSQSEDNLPMKAHSWLAQSRFIGQNRSIISTLRLLQMFGSVLDSTSSNECLVLKPGCFGRQWDERRKKATTIQGDLDEFLMGDVLPLLMVMCYDGLLSTDLPCERELLTFFTELKTFVKNPLQPVSWSLVFSVHLLLTSIMEVQGNDDVQNIGTEAKSGFDVYMGQIDWAMTTFGSSSGRAQHWHANIKKLSSLRWLVRPRRYPPQLTGVVRETKTMRAMWNPLCAGSFLLYLSYFVNLDGGSAMIDNFAQLRMVLHVYNALLQHGAIQRGQIEILDWLYSQFRTCKAVWEGAMPARGQFVYRWWIAYGSTIAASRSKSDNTRASITGNQPRKCVDGDFDAARNMKPVEPKELAKSYRRICLHDFSDVQDKYHTPEQRRKSKHTEIYQHAVQVNDTLDAMQDEDQRLLATNLVSLGELLNEFCSSLFRVLELEPEIQKIIAQLPSSLKQMRRVDGRRANRWESGDANLERQVMVSVFAEKILGPLDFHPRPYEISIVARTSAFLQMYFSRLDPSKVMWFVPTQEEA